MSYDLYFTGEPRGREAFEGHFVGRPNYAVDGRQAVYSNEDTGTYFTFELASPEEAALRDESEPPSWASFNINYFRPSFFAREAAIELEAFTARFGRAVLDPQIDGMGDGEFSVEGFRRGWEAGNRMACRHYASRRGDLHARPGDELRRVWEWNYAREARQDQLGDGIFVPRIGYVRAGGEVFSATVWTDAIPVLLPRTDRVIVFRDELARPGAAAHPDGTALLHWEEVEPWLAGHRTGNAPIPHVYLDHGTPPPALADWIAALPAGGPLEGLPMDRVLDRELLP